MQQFFYAEINAVGMIIMLIMLIHHDNENIEKQSDQVLFRSMLWCNLAVLIVDTVSWLFNGVNTTVGNFIELFSNSVYFILNPITCLLWLLYSVYKLTGNVESLKKWFPLYIIPTLLVAFAVLSSPWTHAVFYINNAGEYVRGNAFLLMPLLSFPYLIFAFAMTLIYKIRKIAEPEPHLYVNLLLFPLLPFVGCIFQTMYLGLSLIWICISLSLLFLFINLQNKQLHTDMLTGLYNRRFFERYLQNNIENRHNTQMLFVVMLDLDRFKSINDEYGHITGDKALSATGRILKKSIGITDVAARYGGDEFVIAGMRSCEQDVADILDNIESACRVFNESGELKCRLSFSSGYAMASHNEKCTYEELIKCADKEMYDRKMIKKCGQRA